MNTALALFQNWTFIRWIRLIFGLGLIILSFYSQDRFGGFVGMFLIFQSVTNTGCCGSNGCSIPNASKKTPKS